MIDYTRRDFLKIMGLGALTATPFSSSLAKGFTRKKAPENTFYVGTFTDTGSKGIYQCVLDPESGKISHNGVTEGIDNPSFVTFGRYHNYLYSVGETAKYKGLPGGSVNAYRINRGDGSLEFINSQPSHGASPCHIYVDKSNQFVMAANYVTGNVAVYPIMDNGGLGYASDIDQHHGSGANPDRQKGPHAHCIITDPENRNVLSCDLGTDKVMIYKFDSDYGTLIPASQPYVELKPGSGPRHIKFHPNGKIAYVISEMGSAMSVFDYESGSGHMKEIQRISTLPDDFNGNNTCAELQVSSDGKFLYGSNRGHDSIVVFSIDPSTGKLTTIQHQSVMGKTPRHFNLDPSEKFALAANQDSNNVVVLNRDENSGKLSPTGHEIAIPKPVCVKFL